MNTLPIVPKPGTAISIAQIEQLESHVAREIAKIDDIDALEEWHAQAAALEAYLRGRELNGPMLGAQRRVEARIGQLLGSAEVAQRSGKHLPVPRAEQVTRVDRNRFRILARGLEHGLPEDAWRSAREPLIKLIQEKYPMPRHVPTVVKENGRTAKPRIERVKEITKLAESGHRAAQIAEKTGLDEKTVRKIAGEAEIPLPDAAIGKVRKLDAKRILTETINGVDAYVSGLSMLDEIELPSLSDSEKQELMQALSRSINGLRKLRSRMESQYARSNATAA